MTKRNFHRLTKNNSLKIKVGAVVIITILISGLVYCFPHFIRSSYKIVVIDKRIIKQHNTERYIIYTQLDDGRLRVFENKNSLLELKINAQDIYYGLMVNRKYEIEAYGFDMPLLSCYQNISRVKGIKTNFPYYYIYY